MTLLKDLGAELFKMFMADARLTVSVLILVGLIAAVLRWTDVPPLAAGAALALGAVAILLEAVARERRLRVNRPKS